MIEGRSNSIAVC